jgi:hypothetical protein
VIFPRRQQLTWESIGRLWRVKPKQDANGLGNGLTLQAVCISWVASVLYLYDADLLDYPTITTPAVVGREKIHVVRRNQARWECDAVFEGINSSSEPHECQEHEIRLQGNLRCKPLRGWENLKVDLTGWGKPRVSELELLYAVGAKNSMRGACLFRQGLMVKL